MGGAGLRWCEVVVGFGGGMVVVGWWGGGGEAWARVHRGVTEMYLQMCKMW